MEQKEIIEGNKLIAEFMGAAKSWYGDYMIFTVDNPQYTGKINHSDIKYHSSWDWLMPVVEKIKKLGWQFQLNSYEVSNEAAFINGENFIRNTSWSTPLLATYNTVIDFIKWHTQPHP